MKTKILVCVIFSVVIIAMAIGVFYIKGDLSNPTGSSDTAIVVTDKPGFPRTVSASEIQCLALNIYHEARGESTKGKTAIVYIVLNRSLSTYGYGSSKNFCSIIKAKNQFSWVPKFDFNNVKVDWQQYVPFIKEILKTYSIGNSPIKDATHFVNAKNATSKDAWWNSDKMKTITTIGNHLFLKVKAEKVMMPGNKF